MPFDENEISLKAVGGTEIAKRSLAALIDPILLDNFQIVSSRPRDFDWEKIRVMYFHDLPEDPESVKFREPSFRDNFAKFVFISNWQFQRYQLFHGIPSDSKSVVIETGIEPARADVCDIHRLYKEDGKIRIVYTSTPQRGLDILVEAIDILSKDHPEIELHVYSSFKIYGWDDADKQFEELYEKIRNHPNMVYHGFTPHGVLLQDLNDYNIFAYPSVWQETSCRAMLEAMSAGLLCVHSDTGALPETSGGMNIMYHADLTNKSIHLQTFLNHLDVAIKMVKTEQHENIVRFNKVFVDRRFNIERIKSTWEYNLRELLTKYPAISDRKKPSEMFVFDTARR